ncbi:adenosine deaminase [Cohnella algarum]|uniref:adenosine deaminase n=1 Tax=Cohnella algarum TaxID=2044859 RepID=UPI00196708A4|nr:adenosine deaminase [Cohnella algarum]MBN2979805.1 adenosine deaminase [Cohnella algarum]
MRTEETELLRRLPKTDLHIHLDGSLKPSTLVELAQAQGIELPASGGEGMRPYMTVGDECASLVDYLSKFHWASKVLHTAEALERAAFELAEQAAEHGVRYVEVRLGPQLHREKGLAVDEVLLAAVRGLARGEAAFGVKGRVIAACLRNHSVAANREVVEAAVRLRDQGVAAVDLAGPEAGHPPEAHRDAFAPALQAGMPITIHAGEAAGPESVRGALEALGANRIGHGVRTKENPALLALVRERRVPLEMCPVSNIQTKAAADWESYPIRDYFDQGLFVTVHTDNMTVSNTDMTKEYAVLIDKYGFTMPEIGRLILNGVEAAFLDETEKAELRKEFVRELRQLGIEVG